MPERVRGTTTCDSRSRPESESPGIRRPSRERGNRSVPSPDMNLEPIPGTESGSGRRLCDAEREIRVPFERVGLPPDAEILVRKRGGRPKGEELIRRRQDLATRRKGRLLERFEPGEPDEGNRRKRQVNRKCTGSQTRDDASEIAASERREKRRARRRRRAPPVREPVAPFARSSAAPVAAEEHESRPPAAGLQSELSIPSAARTANAKRTSDQELCRIAERRGKRSHRGRKRKNGDDAPEESPRASARARKRRWCRGRAREERRRGSASSSRREGATRTAGETADGRAKGAVRAARPPLRTFAGRHDSACRGAAGARSRRAPRP